jgi:hypothetical protein
MISLLKKQKTTNNDRRNTVQQPVKHWIKYSGAQDKCFDRAGDDEFFAAKQEPYLETFTYTYNSFQNVDDFLAMTDNYKGAMTFNEVIREDYPCVEYYDIDCSWEQGWHSIHECVMAFLKLRNEYREQVFNRPVDYEDLIITEACDEKELSLHIIIRHPMYFKNTRDHRIWSASFQKWIDKKYPESAIELDVSVYNKNSLMRCVGSHKIRQPTRPFRPYGLAKQITDKRLFFCSYVEKYYGVVGEVSYLHLPFRVLKSKEIKDKKITYPQVASKEELENCTLIINTLQPKRSDNYNDWFSVGSSLYHTLQGSEEGLQLFLTFSAKCEDKYNENKCRDVWSKMEGSGYTKGTLIHLFNEDKPDIPKCCFKKRRKPKK